MAALTEAEQEIRQYVDRLENLYANIKSWIRSRAPEAKLNTTDIELVEDQTAPYRAASMELVLPGKNSIRFIPRGIYMVGARGRVDVRSRLGSEILVWVEPALPVVSSGEENGGIARGRISRPLYSGIAEGWAWSDAQHNRLVALTEAVLWDEVIPSLTA
jgi:hypothetical protein